MQSYKANNISGVIFNLFGVYGTKYNKYALLKLLAYIANNKHENPSGYP